MWVTLDLSHLPNPTLTTDLKNWQKLQLPSLKSGHGQPEQGIDPSLSLNCYWLAFIEEVVWSKMHTHVAIKNKLYPLSSVL